VSFIYRQEESIISFFLAELICMGKASGNQSLYI